MKALETVKKSGKIIAGVVTAFIGFVVTAIFIRKRKTRGVEDNMEGFEDTFEDIAENAMRPASYEPLFNKAEEPTE